MPDRVILRQQDIVVETRSHQIDIVVPYAGAGTHLHMYASEIAGNLRSATTSADDAPPLRGIVVGFHAAHAEISIRGTKAALGFWLADYRLVKQLQDTINDVHDRHVGRHEP